MATEFDFPNLAPYQAAAAQRALEISRINPIEESILRSRESAKVRDEVLSRQLAAEIQRATLEKLQRPQVFQGSNSVFIEDPTAPGGFRIMSGPPTAVRPPPVTYRYETREDGTYAIPSDNPFSAVRVSMAGSGANLPGRPPTAAKTAQPKWHYETREDGTYAISSEDPTQAVRVTLKDGTTDPVGTDIVSSTGVEIESNFLPGKPRATDKPEKLSAGDISFGTNTKTLLSGLEKLDKLVDKYGNQEGGIVGVSDPTATAELAALPYQIAIQYAKIVDPDSVAREGEVAAAQKYLIPMGWRTRNSVTKASIKNMKDTVELYQKNRDITKGKTSAREESTVESAPKPAGQTITVKSGNKLTPVQ